MQMITPEVNYIDLSQTSPAHVNVKLCSRFSSHSKQVLGGGEKKKRLDAVSEIM